MFKADEIVKLNGRDYKVWGKAMPKPFLNKVYNTEALSPWYA